MRRGAPRRMKITIFKGGKPVKIIYFSKFDQDLSVEKLGEKVKTMGFDGIDLTVRPGHPVNPKNVTEALPKAQKVWNSQGIEATFVTAPIGLLDPTDPTAKKLYAACSEAGIKWIKLGYWEYRKGQDYWEGVERIREALEGFERLSREHGVKTCCHTHSGALYGSNCASLMHLIKGFHPKYIGAYIDTGHLILDGEEYRVGLAVVKDYLSLVALKDAIYTKGEEDGELVDKPKFVPLGKGLVPWKKFFTLLSDTGYDGPLSIHGEYEVEKKIRDKWVKEDLEFIHGVLRTVQK